MMMHGDTEFEDGLLQLGEASLGKAAATLEMFCLDLTGLQLHTICGPSLTAPLHVMSKDIKSKQVPEKDSLTRLFDKAL